LGKEGRVRGNKKNRRKGKKTRFKIKVTEVKGDWLSRKGKGCI